jgi:hypothetical protein
VNVDLVSGLGLARAVLGNEDFGLEVLLRMLEAVYISKVANGGTRLIVNDVGHRGRGQRDKESDLHCGVIEVFSRVYGKF